MRADSWRPQDPARSWRLGVVVAAAATAVLAASLLVAGVDDPVGWWLVAVSAAIAIAAGSQWDAEWVTHGRHWWLQYLWTGAGLAAIGVLTLVVGAGSLRFLPVFGLAAVAGAYSYPRRGQVVLGAIAIATLVLVWWVGPRRTGTLGLLAAVALLVLIMTVVGRLTDSSRAALERQTAARQQLEAQNRLLGLVGRTVTLEAQEALEAVVQAAGELGFEIASVGLIEDGIRTSVASYGIPPPPPVDAELGLGGRAMRAHAPVIVDDYQSDPDRLPHRGAIRSAAAVPITDGPDVTGVLVAGRMERGGIDRTERQILEVLARHAGHALRNARRFDDERRVVERLRALDQLKREFVSNVSHELRTPLTVVGGLADTLHQHPSLEADMQDQLLDRVTDNARRLGQMLGGLLDFSRIDGGQVTARARPTALRALVTRVLSRLQPVLGQHDVTVDAPRELHVLADPVLLEHVLENLLGNVAKHTPPGTSAVVSLRGGHRVRVEVRDTGPGIAADELPRVTGRYYRGVGAAGAGSGIGLALVQDILAAHGTTLDVASEPGGGTRFGFSLPAVAEEEPT